MKREKRKNEWKKERKKEITNERQKERKHTPATHQSQILFKYILCGCGASAFARELAALVAQLGFPCGGGLGSRKGGRFERKRSPRVVVKNAAFVCTFHRLDRFFPSSRPSKVFVL